MRWNPILYLHQDISPVQEAWCHGVGHCLGHTPSLWTHVRPGATAGGLKNQLRSPPSAATIGAAARRLGKVWQLKSIQGSVKHRPCVLRLTHQWGGGDGDGRERERNMFGLQISQNIGCDPRWGVRKKRLPVEVMMTMTPRSALCKSATYG